MATTIDYVNTIRSSSTLLLCVSISIALIAYALYNLYVRRLPSNAPEQLSSFSNLPITGAFGFWTKRWDWYRFARDNSATGNFSFHAGQNPIVALSGETGRKVFFESRELSLGAGYAVLFGNSPKLQDNDPNARGDEYSNHFTRRLTHMIKTSEMKKAMPTLVSDIKTALKTLENDASGMTNPFESVYRIVFKLTIRMVACDELADDPVLLERFLELFEMIDSSATASSIMFPKFPSPAIIKRTYAGARLYMMIEKIIKKRQTTGEKHDDPLQVLLDQGDRTFKIVEVIVAALFAGLLNSGINAAWILCYLAKDELWMGRVREEIRTAAAKYTTNPALPVKDQLDDVPLEAWESEFPNIDLCLRDSIRLSALGTTFRRNISGKSISTGHGSEVIPPGAFVTYATADIHLNPEYYKDPEKWDPSRYLPDRAEDKKAPYGWIGWGIGRHPCLGMRFAKLENNMITAYFLSTFDVDLVNKAGESLPAAPRIDYNGHSANKPNPPIFLKYRTCGKM